MYFLKHNGKIGVYKTEQMKLALIKTDDIDYLNVGVLKIELRRHFLLSILIFDSF